MNSAAARLPPLDPNLAPNVADANTERRVQTLRRLAATNERSLSLRRLAQSELRDLACEIGWERVRAIE